METHVNAPLKEKIRIEFAKLREMKFGDKVGYIWEYYKLHIAGLLMVFFIILSVLNTTVCNPSPESALFISWNAGYATDEQRDDLKGILEKQLIEEGKNEEVVISYLLMNTEFAHATMAGQQRMVAMLSSRALDIFVLDAELLETYAETGFIKSLESILAEIKSINPAVYQRIEENLIQAMCEIEEDVYEERTVGIRVGNSPLFSKLGLSDQDIYIAVALTTEREENIVKAIIMLFE